MQQTTNLDSIFLTSRILFLVTVSESSFIPRLVEELRIVDILGQKCDLLMTSLLSGHAMAKDAMVDLLKFIFNILWRYPRMSKPEDETRDKSMGDLWDDSLVKYGIKFILGAVTLTMALIVYSPLFSVYSTVFLLHFPVLLDLL